MNKLLTTKNNWVTIPDSDPEIKQWFDNFELTQTHHILRQLNEERMYQPFFEDADGLTIVDIGANIGLFSLYAAPSAAKIIAVEPTPRTFEMLKKLTAGLSNITLLPAAASDHNGTVDFYLSDNPTINSAVNTVGESVTVQALTVESILDQYNVDYVDFVKCDIEGGEVVAITDETIGAVADRVGTWAIEVHQTNAHTGAVWPGNLDDNRRALADVFQRHGYSVALVEHDQLFAWK